MSMKGFWVGIAMAVAISLLGIPDAFAAKKAKYKEVPVANGGSVAGKVSFSGTVPPAKLHELSKFPQAEFCGQVDSDGKGHRMQHLVRAQGGALNDVVVLIKDVKEGKAFNFGGTDVTSDICRFLVQGASDFVGVVKTKGEFRVENKDADPNDPKASDGVLHNPHTYNVYGSSSRTIFNKPLSMKGQVLKYKIKLRDLKRSDYMFLQCDQHNFMEAWFHKVSNPYFAVVGADGTFSIGDIPPGTYTLTAWHPMMAAPKEQEITIPAGGSATANFEFTDADVKIKSSEGS